MLSPSKYEAVQDLNTEINEARQNAKTSSHWAVLGFMGSSIVAGMGAAWGYSVFESLNYINHDKVAPIPVEYSSMAVCGLAGAALFLRGMPSPVREAKSWLNNKRRVKELEDKKTRLTQWIDGPKGLTQDEETTVLRFQKQLDTFDQESNG